MNGPPNFVVVGCVNRGKSSIVSTLAADENVVISNEPGTTTYNHAYPVRIGEHTLYNLIDTPGFQRARHVLKWLKGHSQTTQDRTETVRAFLEQHQTDEKFEAECRLLTPVLDGGAILYVVDGSSPVSEPYEAEMEILRWTGRPRMALINRVHDSDHTEQWQAVLDQYFSLVRPFNAHLSGFDDRIELLRAIRELRPEYRTPIDRALDMMSRQRTLQAEDSAALIASMLAEILLHTEQKKLSKDADPEAPKQLLQDRYYATLRDIEFRCREEVRGIYRLSKLQVEESELSLVSDDLFEVDTWSRIGLTKDQLASATTLAGAVAGGMIDAAVGGASLLLGSVLGGALGFSATWFGWDKLEEVKVAGGLCVAGKQLRIGPMKNTRFPWVVLDRALLYHQAVSRRAHARRDPEQLSASNADNGLVSSLDASVRGKIEACFAKLRKGGSQGPIVEELCGILSREIGPRRPRSNDPNPE